MLSNDRISRLLAAVALSMALLVPVDGGAQPAPVAPKQPVSLELTDGALVAPGNAADLELLFTGDVIGYIEPCG